MFSFLKKKESDNKQENSQRPLTAFISGKVIPIEEVPDPVFAEKTLGDGAAIEPDDCVITAPCNGIITAVMSETKHAVGIRTSEGMELLIHEGLDTVAMGGDGFEVFVKEGQSVKRGDKLIAFDPQKILSRGLNTICILAVSNDKQFPDLTFETDMTAIQGETVIARY